MTDVAPADALTLISSKKEKLRSIRTSRKRKLHVFFAVAQEVDSIPHPLPIADDEPLTNPEESKFFHDNVVLQGPFLNERNLPARRLSPLNIPTPHDIGATSNNNVSSVAFEKTQVNVIKPPPTSLTSSILRPGGVGETRAASPNALPTSPLPLNAASPLRNDHGNLPSTLEPGQSSEKSQPDAPGQNGSSPAPKVGELERTNGPREGLVGREVTFAEPQKNEETPGHVNGTSQPSAVRENHNDNGQHEGDPDAMDIDVDEAPGLAGEPSRLTSLRPVPVDASRATDVLSSPGSTAQTATTPAVHDASPDTSPDNEGPQYPAEDDESAHPSTEKAGLSAPEPEAGNEGVAEESDREPGASQAASAQLLSESASAAISTKISGHTTSIPSLDPPAPVQSATQGHSPLDEKGSGAKIETDTAVTSPGPTVQHSATQDEGSNPLQTQTSADNVADLESHAPAGSTSQQTIGTKPSLDDTTPIQPESQRPLSPQLSPSTPAPSAEISGSFSGYQQRRQAASTSLLRKRGLAERQGRIMKKAPTIVFEKVPKKADETIVASPSSGRPPRIPTDDYFVPLFLDGFARQSQWMKSPEQLLANTHKTLSSPDCNIVLQENQACKVLRRIYHLQQHDKWSLRQFKRCPEPTRQPSHWDLMLQEMKWMRTDFREERKWKRTIAQALAEACALWVTSDDQDRKLLQVNAKIPESIEKLSPASDKAATPSEADSLPTPMPDLVPSEAADSPMDVDDEPQEWNVGTVAPSAIFALQDDEVVFGLQMSAASEQLLSELPLYNAPLKIPQWDATAPEFDPDASWRRPALPLSKYVEGEMILKPAGPPLRQSRYKYAVEDEEDDFEVAGGSGHDTTAKLPPENTDVALFRPEMKVIRDRLHSSHQFRPPTESLMPSQSFYENRTGSTWTTADDDELRRQVREYSYNWSLISKNISYNSLFVSAEERRTPWECFERWVNLEGFPNDVARTQYFRTYQNRIESAQRATAAANQSNASANANAKPQVDSNGVVMPPQRRRTTLPSRVDRRVPRRYFHIFDAMKKLAKKREQAAAKQQQTANNQNRRASENNQQKLPTKTPEDYSRLKHERERQMQEKLHRFNLQQEAQRQAAQAAALQGRAPNQMGRVPGAPGAAQVAQNTAAGQIGGMANPLAARLAGQGQVAGQARRMPIQQQQALQQQQQQALAAQMAAAGGLGPQVPLNVAGMSQAQIAAMQAQARLQVPDANLVLQARRIQDQQRRQQLAQQQAQAVQAQAQVHQHPQQQQGGQQQQQQLPPQHSPPQAQAQPTPQNQPNHAMPNVSAAQANSPNMRNGINGINGNNFVMNNMAYAPNGMAMATSPGGMAMGMQNLPAGSPPGGFTAQPRGLPPSMQGHFAEIENQIRSHNPEAPPGTIRQMALMRFQQVFRGQAPKSNVAQNAMDAAAGSASQQQVQANGIANASSPQQYAQMLRQQQQQQSGSQHAQAQQQALAQQAARQANQQQHQRQPSAGATPVPNR